MEFLIPSTYGGGEIAAAKASRDPATRKKWTRRNSLTLSRLLMTRPSPSSWTRLLELVDVGRESARRWDPLAYEKKGVFFRAYGLPIRRLNSAIGKGRLIISGCWTGFKGVANHSGFKDLANLLRMEVTGPAVMYRCWIWSSPPTNCGELRAGNPQREQEW